MNVFGYESLRMLWNFRAEETLRGASFVFFHE
jgi:hypothetical protein